MARKLRIALISTTMVVGVVVACLTAAYFAARQVRPFYHQALEVDPDLLAERRREMESRATALYSDTREPGRWHAQFTAEQINGWLASQLTQPVPVAEGSLPATILDPRVAISPGMLTLGFRTTQGGIEMVVSVDAEVSLTADGEVAIQFKSVRAGTLPLPIMQIADQLAAGCRDLKLPVRWAQQGGEPIAIVDIDHEESSSRRLFLDAIELNEGELYVAGHTKIVGDGGELTEEIPPFATEQNSNSRSATNSSSVELTGYELRLTPRETGSALEIGRTPSSTAGEQAAE